MKIAIFDFDGTLYKKETFQLLMDHLKHHPKYKSHYKKFLLPILPPYTAYKLKVYPEAKMKQHSMNYYLSALKHLNKDELTTYFQEIANRMKEDFNEKVLSELKNHHDEGTYTMIVSGAYTPLLEVAMKDYPIDEIIGTDIVFDENNQQKDVPLYHVQGLRKQVKLQNFLKGKTIDWENSYSYGDSYSDLPILELVGHPVVVQADEKLKKIAEERGWKTID